MNLILSPKRKRPVLATQRQVNDVRRKEQHYWDEWQMHYPRGRESRRW